MEKLDVDALFPSVEEYEQEISLTYSDLKVVEAKINELVEAINSLTNSHNVVHGTGGVASKRYHVGVGGVASGSIYPRKN